MPPLMKVCPACGERAEPQFEKCWKCGGPLSDPEPIAQGSIEASQDESISPPPAARPPPASNLVVLETLAFVLIAFAGTIVFHGVGSELDTPPITARDLVVDLLPNLGWILLIVCLLHGSGPFDWKLPSTVVGWIKEFAWGAVLYGAAALVSFVVTTIATSAGAISRPTPWDDALQDSSTMLAFLMTAPLSALQEELVNRVYLQTRLTQVLRGRPVLVVGISSWLFAAAHGYAPTESLGLFAFGVVFGTSFQINGRIPRLVIAHTASNLIWWGW